MAYQVVAILMAFSDLQGDAPNAGLLNVIFSYVVQLFTRFQRT